MAVVFPHKLIFLEQPRTGSTAVRAALTRIGGVRYKRHKFVPARRGESVASTVREPYSMWVTWFLNRGKSLGITDMLEFTETYSLIDGQLYWFAKYATVILHYEDLENELNALLKRLRIRTVKLAAHNVTANKHKDPMSYYSPEALEAFNERYADEFTKYGYRTRSII